MRIPILLRASVLSMVVGGCQLLSGVTKLEVTTGGAGGGIPVNCGDGHLDPGELCDDGPDNGKPGKCLADCSAVSKKVTVSGYAVPLGDESHPISGAAVSVVEHAELGAVMTDDAGHFSFDGIYQGEEVTLQMFKSGYVLIQTGTHVVPVEGIDDLTFQAPTETQYAMSAPAGLTPDPTKCQMVTVATRKGGTALVSGPQGEAGVTVTLAPPNAEAGPIYTDETSVPVTTLKETTVGGGVFFVNAPPGEYVMSGQKPGVVLEDVKLKCRAGVLVFASAPRGMNVL